MVTSKPKNILKLTPERLMSYFSIFFFSTIFMIAGIALSGFNTPTYRTVSIIFGIIFFTGYFYLFLELLIYYLTKMSKWVNKAYEKHYLWFWVTAIVIFIIAIGIGLFFFLGKEKFIEIAGGTFLMICLGGLWKVILLIKKKYYDDKKKN